MTPQEEAVFEAKAEKMLKSHRELQSGRDFRAFYYRFRSEDKNFEDRFYNTFPSSPGSPEWWDKKFKRKKQKTGIKTGYHHGGFLG